MSFDWAKYHSKVHYSDPVQSKIGALVGP